MRILMCRADYFRVDYVINPWMKVGSVDEDLAKEQWQNLHDVYVSLGVRVEVIEPVAELPDMVFAADQGIYRDGKVLLSRFRYPQRREESTWYSGWFE